MNGRSLAAVVALAPIAALAVCAADATGAPLRAILDRGGCDRRSSFGVRSDLVWIGPARAADHDRPDGLMSMAKGFSAPSLAASRR
jgi:hypothetical protein